MVQEVQLPCLWCVFLYLYSSHCMADSRVSLVSAALDGGTQVMVFVYTFAVGGGSGKVVDMPLWGLVRRLAVLCTSRAPSDLMSLPISQNPAGNPDYCLRLTS